MSITTRIWDSANKALEKLNGRISLAFEGLDNQPREKMAFPEPEFDELSTLKTLLLESEMLNIEVTRQSCQAVAEKEAELLYWKRKAGEAGKERSISVDSQEYKFDLMTSEKQGLEHMIAVMKQQLQDLLADRNAFLELKQKHSSLEANNAILKSIVEESRLEVKKVEARNKILVAALVDEYSDLVEAMERRHTEDILLLLDLSESNEVLQERLKEMEASQAEPPEILERLLELDFSRMSAEGSENADEVEDYESTPSQSSVNPMAESISSVTSGRLDATDNHHNKAMLRSLIVDTPSLTSSLSNSSSSRPVDNSQSGFGSPHAGGVVGFGRGPLSLSVDYVYSNPQPNITYPKEKTPTSQRKSTVRDHF